MSQQVGCQQLQKASFDGMLAEGMVLAIAGARWACCWHAGPPMPDPRDLQRRVGQLRNTHGPNEDDIVLLNAIHEY